MEIPHNLFERIPRLPGVSENQEPVAAFERYWQHYEMMQEWMGKYVKAWKDNRSSYARKMTHSRKSKKKSKQKTDRQDMSALNRASYNTNSGDRPFSPAAETASAEGVDSGKEGSPDSDFEVEVSEEFKQFFIQSQKHRDEREKRKHDEVKEREQDGEGSSKLNVEAPKERPGSKRNEEMKILYGKHTPMIQGLETAIQMEFDHLLDRKQPQLWPSIALNL